MTKNLEAADHIVKLVLAICTLALYFAGVIAGPFAIALVVLSLVILIIFAVRLVLRKYPSGKEATHK
jgi:hypothetical protein